MTLRTPLGQARGLGSAKDGSSHARATIVTAVALVPLSLWLVYSLIHLAGADYADFAAWLKLPLNASLMILSVLMITYHAQLGVQMVVEDYVHCEIAKSLSVIASKIIAAFLAVFMTVSILKVAVGG